jgi:hypothetical protein
VATVTCTPGGASDNSYVTLHQANDYFAGDERGETWQSWSSADRETFLVGATRFLERRLGGARPDQASPARSGFVGSPYDEATPQALHFPRSTDLTSAGAKIVPEGVQDAVCEQAFWRLWRRDHPPVVDRDELRADGVAYHMEPGVGSEQLGPTGRPGDVAPRAWEAIRPFVVGGGIACRVTVGSAQRQLVADALAGRLGQL